MLMGVRLLDDPIGYHEASDELRTTSGDEL
jgi:hypothetical protein